MTQLGMARKGDISPQMEAVARVEEIFDADVVNIIQILVIKH